MSTVTEAPSGYAASAPKLNRRRRGRDRVGLVFCAVGIALVAMAVAAPLVAPSDPAQIVGAAQLHPSGAHVLGTDQLGRDVLSRTIYGSRVSLTVGVLSALLAAVLGTPFGLLAGYLGRAPSAAIMRSVDVFLAIPSVLLALVIVTIRGPGITTVVAAVGIAFAPVFARVMYASTRRAREQDFIDAARVVGCSHWRVLSRHIFPVVLPDLVVLTSNAVSATILLSATLNFLGFGVHPPTAAWGADLSAGVAYLSHAWWISTAPGVAITIAILAANFVGDYIEGRLSNRGEE